MTTTGACILAGELLVSHEAVGNLDLVEIRKFRSSCMKLLKFVGGRSSRQQKNSGTPPKILDDQRGVAQAEHYLHWRLELSWNIIVPVPWRAGQSTHTRETGGRHFVEAKGSSGKVFVYRPWLPKYRVIFLDYDGANSRYSRETCNETIYSFINT